MTIPDLSHSEEDFTPPLYQIDFERLNQLRRSAVFVLASRRPLSAPSRLKAERELSDPQELVDEIAAHYSEDEDFIRSDMPIQEIVLRILLTRHNQPTPLDELHQELTERWSTPTRPIAITLDGLKSIMDNDNFYGFQQVTAGD